MLATDILDAIASDSRFKPALEEMATNPLSDIGDPVISSTFTAYLDAGPKTVRISIAMVNEGETFADD